MNADEIDYRTTYQCRIKMRETFGGRAIKDGVQSIDGLVLNLCAGWISDNDENYPGEWAMLPSDQKSEDTFDSVGISWIASGDVEKDGD